jgi:hypothetical protein
MKRLSISIHKLKTCRKNIELSLVSGFAKPPKKGKFATAAKSLCHKNITISNIFISSTNEKSRIHA